MTCPRCRNREEQFIRRDFIAWWCRRCQRTAIRMTSGNMWKRFRAEFIDLPDEHPGLLRRG